MVKERVNFYKHFYLEFSYAAMRRDGNVFLYFELSKHPSATRMKIELSGRM
ncbi:hypothetical protein MYP_334 [Sporocytophaga myxococcoides]|uniref:Uncharacterized protein n=1 Tax=Sporocytophaga myxococcoides TaxID=153721 RepID=A0A098L9Y6_9BACT|nr:hypothetical protein MYP_334 [Sporocytophaga myxococcoides]